MLVNIKYIFIFSKIAWYIATILIIYLYYCAIIYNILLLACEIIWLINNVHLLLTINKFPNWKPVKSENVCEE